MYDFRHERAILNGFLRRFNQYVDYVTGRGDYNAFRTAVREEVVGLYDLGYFLGGDILGGGRLSFDLRALSSRYANRYDIRANYVSRMRVDMLIRDLTGLNCGVAFVFLSRSSVIF